MYSKKSNPKPFEEFVSSKYDSALLLVNFLFFNLANWMLLRWQRSKKRMVKLWLCQLIKMGRKGSCAIGKWYVGEYIWTQNLIINLRASSSKGKKKLSSSYNDGNDLPSDEDGDGDRISDGDQQVQRYPNSWRTTKYMLFLLFFLLLAQGLFF